MHHYILLLTAQNFPSETPQTLAAFCMCNKIS